MFGPVLFSYALLSQRDSQCILPLHFKAAQNAVGSETLRFLLLHVPRKATGLALGKDACCREAIRWQQCCCCYKGLNFSAPPVADRRLAKLR